METFDHIKAELEFAFQEQSVWREHGLILRLKQRAISPIDQLSLSDMLELFKAHFLIRNGLYQLRSKWRKEKLFDLSIEAIEIKRVDYQNVLTTEQPSLSRAIANGDLLEQYYLDLSNYYKTTQAEVELMLKGFWQQLQDPQETAEAHAILGLAVGAGYQEIKRAFRLHAQRIHPDKGGNEKDFKELTRARDTLLAQKTRS